MQRILLTFFISSFFAPLAFGQEVELCAATGSDPMYLHQDIEAPLDEVWYFYSNAHPSWVWSSTIELNESVPSDWEGLSPGQDIRTKMNYMGIPVGLDIEVTRVDPGTKEVHFRYTDNAPATGFQIIRLHSTQSGVHVRHLSCYRGRNFIFHALYPDAHRKILDPMHENAKFFIELRASRENICGGHDFENLKAELTSRYESLSANQVSNALCDLARMDPLEVASRHKNENGLKRALLEGLIY